MIAMPCSSLYFQERGSVAEQLEGKAAALAQDGWRCAVVDRLATQLRADNGSLASGWQRDQPHKVHFLTRTIPKGLAALGEEAQQVRRRLLTTVGAKAIHAMTKTATLHFIKNNHNRGRILGVYVS